MKMRLFSVLVGIVGLFISCQTQSSRVAAPEAKDEVVNGDFTGGAVGWSFWSNGGKGKGAFSDGVFTAAFTDREKAPWDAVLQQNGFSLRKGKTYRLRFSGQSDSSQRIRVGFTMVKEPYYLYSGPYYFTLSPGLKEYSFEFTMLQDSTDSAAIQFCLGWCGAGRLVLDDIALVFTGEMPPVVIPVEFPEPRSLKLRRGIQFGLQFAAPKEGASGPEFREEYLDVIMKDGRFDHIRMPVWWEYHTLKTAPYTVDPEYMDRVDWAVSSCLKRGYPTVLNVHWFRAMEKKPLASKDEYLALWRQIAGRFRDYPGHLYFDVMNEPNGILDAYWNRIIPEVYDAIREISPERSIIISGPFWAHMSQIPQLSLPQRIQDDQYVLIQFHPYDPNDFCFQGTIGNGEAVSKLRGIRWRGTDAEKKFLRDLFDGMEAWSARNGNLPLYNGEFTANCVWPEVNEDRLRWIRFIREECESRGIGWNYYDFSEDTCKVYDIVTDQWDERLMDALFGP